MAKSSQKNGLSFEFVRDNTQNVSLIIFQQLILIFFVSLPHQLGTIVCWETDPFISLLSSQTSNQFSSHRLDWRLLGVFVLTWKAKYQYVSRIDSLKPDGQSKCFQCSQTVTLCRSSSYLSQFQNPLQQIALVSGPPPLVEKRNNHYERIIILTLTIWLLKYRMKL